MFGDSHDRDDALALEAIAVDLGILGILDLLVFSIPKSSPIAPENKEIAFSLLFIIFNLI